VTEAYLSKFQYLALIRYCQNTHSTRKPLQDALATAENKLAAMQDIATKEHDKVVTLQQDNEKLEAAAQMNENLKAEVERLRGVDQENEQYRRLDVNPKDLATFKNNKDAIRHYLKLVPILIEYATVAIHVSIALIFVQAEQQNAKALSFTRVCYGLRTDSQSQRIRSECLRR
jgi:hypothetical protein